MADLTELQSSGSVKIVGSDSSGQETNFVNSTSVGLLIDASNSVIPLPTGASTAARQDSANTKLDAINTHLTTIETYVDGVETLIGTTNTEIGVTNEVAPASDTATSGLNGRLQRVAQRLTSMITATTDGTQKTQIVDLNGNVLATADASISGSITAAGQSVTLALPFGTSSTEIQLTGTFVGTLVFESSVNGVDFNPRVCRSSGVLNLLSTSTSTVPSEWRGNSAGMSSLRVRCTAYTSGTATVYIRSSTGTGAVFLNAAIPIGGQSTGNTSVVSLAAGASFTGAYEDLSNTASISVGLIMSQSGTLKAQFSQDGTTLFQETSYSITAGAAFTISMPPVKAQYFRVVVTNTSGSTSTVGLETLYRAVALDFTRLQLGDTSNLKDTTLASVNKAIIAGRSSSGGGTYVDIKVDPSGVINTTPSYTATTPSAPTSASVGITSAQALAANSSRRGLILTNTSTAKISLGLGNAAVLNSGITLYPGGTWVMDEFTFTTAAINAIASLAASGLATQELT